MKYAFPIRSFMSGLALALPCLFLAPQAAADDIDINIFVNQLEPYGRWVETGQYGLGWIPNNVSRDWQPYTDGRWVWTDEYGWTWVSDQEWGWAPFHYGRWYRDDRHGWTWIPGTEWAPAWVAWRRGGDHVGWAPLPPQVRWSGGSPLRYDSFDLDDLIDRFAWVFTERRYFVSPDIRQYILPAPRVVQLIPVTRNVTYYAPFETRIVNRSIPLEYIAAVVGGAVPRWRVESVGSFDTWKGRRADKQRLYVYRPDAAGGSWKAKGPKNKAQVKVKDGPGKSGVKVKDRSGKSDVKVKDRPGKGDVKVKESHKSEWQGEPRGKQKTEKAEAKAPGKQQKVDRKGGGPDQKQGGKGKGKGSGKKH